MVLRGRILEKFLLGRQVFVVVVVFMLARITSPTDLTRFMGADLPGWLTSFIATGQHHDVGAIHDLGCRGDRPGAFHLVCLRCLHSVGGCLWPPACWLLCVS